MNRFGMLTIGLVLAAVAVGPSPARAAGPGSDLPPAAIDGTLRVVNAKLGLIQLSDGTEMRVNDPRQLDELKVGDQVHIVFEQRNGRNIVLSMGPRGGASAAGATAERQWIAPDGVTDARLKQDRYECLKESASLHQQELYGACMEARGYRPKPR